MWDMLIDVVAALNKPAPIWLVLLAAWCCWPFGTERDAGKAVRELQDNAVPDVNRRIDVVHDRIETVHQRIAMVHDRLDRIEQQQRAYRTSANAVRSGAASEKRQGQG